MSDILEKLLDLHKQATTERSHYYVAGVTKEAANVIKLLRMEVAHWKGRYEDERRDHEATIKHTERQLDEFSA